MSTPSFTYTPPEDVVTTPEDEEAEVLAEARKAYDDDYSMMSEDRIQAKEDIDFADGDQWGPDGQARRAKFLPTIQVNQLDQYKNQILNNFRQNDQAIKIRPNDEFATVETAQELEALMRHIEQRSDAKEVYVHGLEQMVKSGLGFARVYYDYVNEMSFDQEVIIEAIQSRFSVVPGYAEKLDFSDMTRCFVTEEVPRSIYEELYPNFPVTDWPTTDASYSHWFGEDTVTVGEYWKIKMVDDTLLKLSSNHRIFKSILDAKPGFMKQHGLSVVKERPTKRREVWWRKMIGTAIISTVKWRGRWIPIVPFCGNKAIMSDGRVIFSGLIRNGKDPQKMFNFWSSIETQLLARQSKRKVIAAEGQLEGYEAKWADDDEDVLVYRPKVLSGQLVQAPKFEQFEGVPAGVVNAKNGCRDDIRAALGMYQDSAGAPSNATTGVAIAKRQAGSQLSSYHYLDHASISIQHIGRICVDLERSLPEGAAVCKRVLDPNGKARITLFNEPHTDANGKKVLFDMEVGEYEVTVDTGPSYVSKRQETVQTMLEIAKYIPDLMKVGGDIFAENIDAPKMEILANRLRAMMDPKIVAMEQDGQNKDAMLTMCQQQLNVAQQAATGLKQAVALLTQELQQANDKRLDREFEFKAKTVIAEVQARTALEVQRLKNIAGADQEAIKQLGEMDQDLQDFMAELDKNSNVQDDTAVQTAPTASTGAPTATPPAPDSGAVSPPTSGVMT